MHCPVRCMETLGGDRFVGEGRGLSVGAQNKEKLVKKQTKRGPWGLH